MAHIQLVGLAEMKSPDDKIWKFPYAFSVIIRRLLDSEHSFDIIDTHLHKKSAGELIDYLKQSNANIFGISAFSHNYALVKLIAHTLKEVKPDSTIVVGGILSGNYKILLEKAKIDIVCTAAEGEMVLPEILDALDGRRPLESISGIAFMKNGKVIKTPHRKVMSNKDYQDTPLPAYEYFDEQLQEIADNVNQLENLPVKGFTILTMRGCPFKCTFCGHLYGHRFLKMRWDKFFSHLEFLVDRYGITGFFCQDTNQFLNEKDAYEYCRLYSKGNHTFKICSAMRPTFGDVEMFRALKKNGVEVILFGMESGSQRLLDRMKKKFNLKKMKEVFKAAMDAGLHISGNFIFGTPGENIESVKETRDLMFWLENEFYKQRIAFAKDGREPCTSGYGFTFLVPSPTSELYQLALDKGFITDEETYLLQLSNDDHKLLAKGSRFKLALAEAGADINMSDFPSKSSLVRYVNYSIALTKWRAYKLDKETFDGESEKAKTLLKNMVDLYFDFYKNYEGDITIEDEILDVFKNELNHQEAAQYLARNQEVSEDLSLDAYSSI